MTRTIAAYGTWTSPVSAEMVAGQSLRFAQLQFADGTLYWAEQRPAEEGRTAIVAWSEGEGVRDVMAAPFSARSRVHEYGGGAYLARGDEVFFVNEKDQAVYRVKGAGAPEKIAHEPRVRCADFAGDPLRPRLVAVAECQRDGMAQPENLLVSIGLEGPRKGRIETLASGRDFYAGPRFSPDGDRLCWIEWDLPWMPWERSRVMVADVGTDGQIGAALPVGGGGEGSVFQAEWDAQGRLLFVCDEDGWGNLREWDGGASKILHPMAAEFGRPLWNLGTTSYAVDAAGDLVASYIEEGGFKLAGIERASGAWRPIDTPFRQVDDICASAGGVAFVATRDDAAPEIVRLPLDGASPGTPQVLRRSSSSKIEAGTVSAGRQIAVPVSDGIVHALYYPPANAAFAGPDGAAPPLIAAAHGGPTGMADRGLKLKIQYWTSRGFAFVDVDYRGSFGYGRAYRDALNGHWGVRDVEDVIAAARWLVDQGLADGERLLISGGSAGGFTVLSALTFHDVFAAGASYYGIGDLQKLLDLTHKFESGYLYNLTGTEPGRTDEVFKARSPLFHADRISSPVIFFQGTEDKVVPPGQSREMVAALKRQGIPVAYLEYEGEGHGFRQSKTLVSALASEYAFYARVLGLAPGERLPDIEIHNMEALPGELRK